MKFIKKVFVKYPGIFLGLIAYLISMLVSVFQGLVDDIYYRGIFQGLRVLYDYTLGFLPFPMVYLLFFALVVFIVQHFRKIQIEWDSNKITASLWMGTLHLISMFGMVGFAFYMLWGYNYQRTPIDQELGLNFNSEIEDQELLDEVAIITKHMLNARKAIKKDQLSIGLEDLPRNLEREVRENLSLVLNEMGYPTHGRPRVRVLAPRGILLRISTAGVYIPFVCEGHIDAGLHPIQRPYTMAHEMTHAYGFTDEGVCNFIAFLACNKSENPLLKYSALRVYWQYLLNQIYKAYPEEYANTRKLLPISIKKDFKEVREYMDRYPDIMPVVRDKIYDSYLKSHGVKSGISSYSQIVRMMMAWKGSKYNSTIQSRLYDVEEVQ